MLSLVRLPGTAMVQEDTGLLQHLEVIILISHFFFFPPVLATVVKDGRQLPCETDFVSYQVFRLCQTLLKLEGFGGRIS